MEDGFESMQMHFFPFQPLIIHDEVITCQDMKSGIYTQYLHTEKFKIYFFNSLPFCTPRAPYCIALFLTASSSSAFPQGLILTDLLHPSLGVLLLLGQFCRDTHIVS